MINILKSALIAGRRIVESVQGLAVESEALTPQRSGQDSQRN